MAPVRNADMTKLDELANLGSYGITPFYHGKIELYQYSDIPSFTRVDLCRKCRGELDEFVNKFMDKDNED